MLTDATADIAFALLLAVARRIVEGEREVREGRWAPWHPSHMLGGDLADQTLGIVGWGRIGQAMARRGEGFGMKIVHSSRSSGIPLEELLEQADYVSLHTPLTPETRHLIGAAELARMKPTAYLINTSRGGTVDQVALREALEARRDRRRRARRDRPGAAARRRPAADARRTWSSCRTSARPRSAPARGWPTWPSTTCSPRSPGEEMPHRVA